MKSNAKTSSSQTLDRKPARKPLLVIGYGNTMRCDDGVGVRVATVLEPPLAAGGSEALASHQLLPEHAESISQARIVIFVDACCHLAAGRVSWRALRRGKDGTAETTPGHRCDPAALLALARTLYGANPQAVVVSIGVRSLDFGGILSAPVARAEARVIRQIGALARRPVRERAGVLRELCAAGLKEKLRCRVIDGGRDARVT